MVANCPNCDGLIKTCTTCDTTYGLEEWTALPFLGYQKSEDDEFEYCLEMRNCTCGSTLGLETSALKKESKK